MAKLAPNIITTQAGTTQAGAHAKASAVKARAASTDTKPSSFDAAMAQSRSHEAARHAASQAAAKMRAAKTAASKAGRNDPAAGKQGPVAATVRTAIAKTGGAATPARDTEISDKAPAKTADKEKSGKNDDAAAQAANDNGPGADASAGLPPQTLQAGALTIAQTAVSSADPDSGADSGADSGSTSGSISGAAPQAPGAPTQANDAAVQTAAGIQDGQTVAGEAQPASEFQKLLADSKAKDNQTAPSGSDKDAKPADARADAGAKDAPAAAPDAKPAMPTGPDSMAALQPATAAPTDKIAAAATPSPGAPPGQAPSAPAPNLYGVAVEIAARSLSGAKQFNIRLDPPELGRIEVRLSIDAGGTTQAHLSADEPRTLDLLQKDAPALTSALRDAGLNVNPDGLNFSLRGQQQQAGGGQNSHSRNGAQSGRIAFAAGNRLESIPHGAAQNSGSSLLDIKV